MNQGPQQIAKRVAKNQFIGAGCLVQGVGFFTPFGGFVLGGAPGALVGVLFFLLLLLVGNRMSRKWACGNCGNMLADDKVRLCPICRATLG